MSIYKLKKEGKRNEKTTIKTEAKIRKKASKKILKEGKKFMCIICVKATKKQLSKEQLKNCWDNNSDGAGILWLENGKFHFQKGFENFKDFRKFWYNVSKDSKISAFHCRIATHGGVKPLLTHPFYIDRIENELNGIGNIALHNGVLSENVYKAYFDDKTDSDTSAFCKKIFLENLSNKDIETQTEGSRFAIFRNGKFKLFGKWIFDNGLYFSNDTYSYKKTFYNYKTKSYYEKMDFYPVGYFGTVYDENFKEVINTKNLFSDDGYNVYKYENGKYKLMKNLYLDDDFYNTIRDINR